MLSGAAGRAVLFYEGGGKQESRLVQIRWLLLSSVGAGSTEYLADFLLFSQAHAVVLSDYTAFIQGSPFE